MGDGQTSRRNFLKAAAISGAGLAVTGKVANADQNNIQLTANDGEQPAAAADVVPRKQLGTTGESIPILLVGCAMEFDPKYDKILHRAYKGGVNYLDTALSYANGQSHKTIAPFIKQIEDRSKLWITSKAPSRGSDVKKYWSNLDICLEQLETDYLDLFFMHAVNDEKHLDREYIKMGDEMKKSGKTKYFGFSCHHGNVVELMNKAADVGGIDAIMFRYNFGQYGDTKLNKAIDKCKKAGIGLIAMKTQRSVPSDLEEVVQFQSKQFTLGQAKLKAVWADERIDAAVSHMDNTQLLAENMSAAMNPNQLTMEEFQQLQRIASACAAYACDGCAQICESKVAANTKIADTLRYLMYAECYHETEKAKKFYAQLTHDEKAIDGVDFREASKTCPQGIDIAKRLNKARQMLA